MKKFSLAILVVTLLAAITPAQAQNRTWVSGVGDDVNPCSRTAPCKTFAGAISKTAAGGEINVLDPGAFGAVTITKSINIIAEGFEAGVLVSGTNAIIVNAGASDVVELRGLDFNGTDNGLAGVKILAADSVHITKSQIRKFGTATSAAIQIVPSAGNVNVFISDTTMTHNKQGVLASPGAGATTKVTVDRALIQNNNGPGIRADNGATVRLSNSVITGNNRGLLNGGTGQIISYGNNLIGGNNTDGTPTSTLPLQ